MITNLINLKTKSIVSPTSQYRKKQKNRQTIVKKVENQKLYYTFNSDQINQVLNNEIGETFPTYYDELKNLDDSWKPISLQGENSKALLLLPFLPKWEIQNDKRIFTGIWDVRNKQQYDLNEKFVQIIWPQTQLLDQRIIGTILGNGGINARTPCVKYTLKNAQHVYWKYIFFKPFSIKAPLQRQTVDNRTSKTYYGYKFWTRSVFQDYRELFYPDGKKIVPLCAPNMLQSPEGLAEFYMDSGTYNKTNGGFYINTCSLKKKEQEFLQEKLFEFHGLESTIQKDGQYLRLYLLQKNSPILIQKLKDHMLPMFYDKLGSVLDTGLKSYQVDESFNRQDLRELQRKIGINDE